MGEHKRGQLQRRDDQCPRTSSGGADEEDSSAHILEEGSPAWPVAACPFPAPIAQSIGVGGRGRQAG